MTPSSTSLPYHDAGTQAYPPEGMHGTERRVEVSRTREWAGGRAGMSALELSRVMVPGDWVDTVTIPIDKRRLMVRASDHGVRAPDSPGG
jgi:hypothetical protein